MKTKLYVLTPLIACFLMVALPWPEFVIVPLRNFIAYSPRVPFVRMVFCVLGGVLLTSAFLYGLSARLCGKCVPVVMSDFSSLRLFLMLLIAVPVLCFVLAAKTNCCFHQFQCSAAFTLFVFGSLIAVRTKRFRYIIYYLVLFLSLGSIVPPC